MTLEWLGYDSMNGDLGMCQYGSAAAGWLLTAHAKLHQYSWIAPPGKLSRLVAPIFYLEHMSSLTSHLWEVDGAKQIQSRNSEPWWFILLMICIVTHKKSYGCVERLMTYSYCTVVMQCCIVCRVGVRLLSSSSITCWPQIKNYLPVNHLNISWQREWTHMQNVLYTINVIILHSF